MLKTFKTTRIFLEPFLSLLKTDSLLPQSVQIFSLLKNTKFQNDHTITCFENDSLKGIAIYQRFGSVFARDKESFDEIMKESAKCLRNKVIWTCIQTRYLPILEKYFKKVGQTDYDLYLLYPNKFDDILKMEFKDPENGELCRINSNDVQLISKYWEWGQGLKTTEQFVQKMIENYNCIGFRLNGKLVSWAVLQDDQSISYCYTLPEYRRMVKI
jgi:hypothetical protein